MEPLCECGEKAKHEITTGWTGPFNLLPINAHLCTKCYAKHLADESVDKLKAERAS